MAGGPVTELVAFVSFVIAVRISWDRVKEVDPVIFETGPVVGPFVQGLVIETVPAFTLNLEVTGWGIGFTSLWIKLSG